MLQNADKGTQKCFCVSSSVLFISLFEFKNSDISNPYVYVGLC